MTHKHRIKTHEITGWTHCVAPQIYSRSGRESVCDGQAHGAVVYKDTCSCGAVRLTESNGRVTRRGEWS